MEFELKNAASANVRIEELLNVLTMDAQYDSEKIGLERQRLRKDPKSEEALRLLEEKKHLISVFSRADKHFDVAVLRAMMCFFKLSDERQQRAELRKYAIPATRTRSLPRQHEHSHGYARDTA